LAVRRKAQRARNLRRNATDAERVLWRALRSIELPGKVRRQHPIGPYIADFAIPACKLAIEIDGGQHASSVAEDRRRTRNIGMRGYRVVRFWNNEVLANSDGVIRSILTEIENGPTSP
jgi:very-short-patch-repair endonuclease